MPVLVPCDHSPILVTFFLCCFGLKAFLPDIIMAILFQKLLRTDTFATGEY